MRSFWGGALGAFGVLGITVMACSTGDSSTGDGTDGGMGSLVDGGTGTTLADGSTDTSNPDGGVSTAYVPFDINHLLVTGQSNETGNDARPPLSTTQPYANLMFDTGPMSMKGGYENIDNHTRGGTIDACDDNGCTTFETPGAFQPLVEGDNFFGPDQNGDKYAVETPAAGAANEIASLATSRFGLPSHVVLASVHGRSGNGYACLRKGGGCDKLPNYGKGYTGYLNAYAQGMQEVTAAKALAAAAKKSYVVRGVVAVHGEQDSDVYFAAAAGENDPDYPLTGTDGTANAIASYTDALLEWQRDYESGAKAITAQTQPVPMFVVQISNWGYTKDAARVASVIPQMQLDAHTKAPGKVVVVGAGYPLPYDQGDCLHFTNEGERRLGEYFGKVYTQVVIAGKTWEPVRPKTITRNGVTVTVQYHVPAPPLVFDTTQVKSIAGMGFTVVDGSGATLASVTSATVANDTVTLTLSGDPGAGAHLRYALNQPRNGCAGPENGARGNLRDSDATPSQSGGAALQNWGVHFDMVMP